MKHIVNLKVSRQLQLVCHLNVFLTNLCQNFERTHPLYQQLPYTAQHQSRHKSLPCASWSGGHICLRYVHLAHTELEPRYCRSSGAALTICSSSKALNHQRNDDYKAADAGAEVSLEAAAATRKHKQSDKLPAEARDPQQTQQAGAATETPTFSFANASEAEATQALASVGLTNDLIQALLKTFTTDQLQACLDNAQQIVRIQNATAAVTLTSQSQPGVMKADLSPSVSDAAQSSTHQTGALTGTASQAAAEVAVQAADDKGGSSLLQEVAGAAGTTEASGAAAHMGVLLVSGSHVRHWLAATNMVSLPAAKPNPPIPCPQASFIPSP